LYQEALEAVDPSIFVTLATLNGGYRRGITAAQGSQIQGLRANITKYLIEGQATLQKLQAASGLPHPGLSVGIEKGKNISGFIQLKAKTAAVLNSIWTLDLIYQGKANEACNSIISLLKLIHLFDTYPTSSLLYSRTGLVLLACQDANLLINALRPSDSSLAKLQQAFSEILPSDFLHESLLAERVYWVERSANLIPSDLLSDRMPNFLDRIPKPASNWKLYKIRKELTRYLRDLDQLIDGTKKDWPAPLILVETDSPQAQPASDEMDIDGSKLILVTAEGLTKTRCTTLALAIKRYYLANQKLPESVEELTPDIIETVPIDPYSGQKLFYLTSGPQVFVVYGMGFDGKDDGGKVLGSSPQQRPLDVGILVVVR
jgi:hypothetical protein